MKPSLSLLSLCILLAACSTGIPNDNNPVIVPTAWQSAHAMSRQLSSKQWWQQFGSPELDQLIAQAQTGSYDLAVKLASK